MMGKWTSALRKVVRACLCCYLFTGGECGLLILAIESDGNYDCLGVCVDRSIL